MDGADMIADFDHHDPLIMADPTEIYRRLREECPVGWSQVHDGFWVVSRYDDVASAAGDNERYCSGQGIAIPSPPRNMAASKVEPQEADGHRHLQIRKQMNTWFAPSRVRAMRPAIEDLSAALLEKCIARISFDLAVDYAVPLASLTMLRILGIPAEYEDPLRKNINVLLHERTAEGPVATQAITELYECISEILEKRTSGPGDDIIDKIAAIEIGGTRANIVEQFSMILSLVFAGLETSALAIASTASCLLSRPDLRDQLIAEPPLIPTAVDEFLRFISPVQAIGRTVASQAELGGSSLSTGDRVLLLYGSANHDPEKFDESEEVVLDRHPNRHVAFGYGVHRCLGQHVARLELDIALHHMLTLLPTLRLAPGCKAEWSFGENRGIRSLPVTLDDEAAGAVGDQ